MHGQAIMTLNLVFATVLTMSHDLSSNSPQTQWVAMVAQAVAVATMTSQNHGQAIFSHVTMLKLTQMGLRAKNCLTMACDVIVAIATTRATMATHWVCGEFDAEPCELVKMSKLRHEEQ